MMDGNVGSSDSTELGEMPGLTEEDLMSEDDETGPLLENLLLPRDKKLELARFLLESKEGVA